MDEVLSDQVDTLTTDKAGLSAELDYIRREDMLDETGRTKPILIQSTDLLREKSKDFTHN